MTLPPMTGHRADAIVDLQEGNTSPLTSQGSHSMLLGGDGDPIIILSDNGVSDGTPVSLASLTQAGIILVISVAVILSNIVVIATFLTTPVSGPKEVLRYYLLSLAVADLMTGVLILPLSVYPALRHQWVYGETICRMAGYGLASLWAISAYTLMWVGVDRYVAFRKPMRYEVVQIPSRCQCWVGITWVTGLLLCLPPALGLPRFEYDILLCTPDWGGMAGYTITLSALVLCPSLITSGYTISYLAIAIRRMKAGDPNIDREFATAFSEQLSTNGHVVATVITLVFWISWTPYAGVRGYEVIVGSRIQVPFLHFGLFWAGLLTSFWKSLLYFAFSPSFRLGLKVFCMSLCCRTKYRPPEEDAED